MTDYPISLRTRALKAGAWSLAGYATTMGIRFASNLTLTRFLAPDAYGVMAVAMVFLTALAMLSDVGLKPNVVQHKEGHSPEFLNTIWVTQVLRGIAIWLVGLICALGVFGLQRAGLVPSRSVYANQQVPFVIAALAFGMLISGFESTRILEHSRKLAIAPLAILEIYCQLASLFVMVVWITFDRSIWALIAGTLTSGLAKTLLSYWLLSGSPNRWQWNRVYFIEILQLGKWILLSSALFFFAGNGDRVLLGGLVDAASLGWYVIAYLFFSSIDQILTRIIVDVSFPALGEVIRNRPKDLSRVYYKFHFYIASFTYFCAGFLAISAPTIIGLLYDYRYQPAGTALRILSVALLTAPFRAATQTFILLGAARLYFYLNAARILILGTATPLGFYIGGFDGAVCGIALSYFSNLPLVIFYSIRFGIFRAGRELIFLTFFPIGCALGALLSITASSLTTGLRP